MKPTILLYDYARKTFDRRQTSKYERAVRRHFGLKLFFTNA